ncbi:CDP-glucose 4,6-dehydratase [Rhizorhabdus dicambivorans]|uniref:CDP-glucose 4,6-dehydratase n=1 Tax=Rhizorhabdus dicambivorans TaxID=1850238 RepID=A0A2A4FQ37_9SPHN|nr:CDP-glucose 4,6-dehydratase [Rhizorhabdus dicambivorans]ATE64036.1 CDP-glucose 4,6-dehydratase [Rhizorhabdus dicambivorans]PCE40229.1 CDP-glucose 4,6-dehydratase [Rhizorhabdus dicambivorans]
MRPDPGFWSGKRVLLTGHSGFKGAWAALWLARMGADVTGLSLAPEDQPSLFELAGVAGRVDHRIVDLRDRAAVGTVLDDQDFDIVLHMAAQALVRESIRDPIATFATNVMGTAHLLDALRGRDGLRAVLVITSDKVYANAETGRAFAEGDALGGKDPYSASKAAAEIVTSSFARSYFAGRVPVATARGGNVIGGGDFSRDRIMADIVRAALAGGETVLRHPEATRPWQHVLDCVAGYLVYAERLSSDPAAPAALNFGPRPDGPVLTVGELATRAIDALGAKPWRHEPDSTSIEARTLGIDTTLAGSLLGFASRLDAPDAVDWTVDWYRRWSQGSDAALLCDEQISRYEDS